MKKLITLLFATFLGISGATAQRFSQAEPNYHELRLGVAANPYFHSEYFSMTHRDYDAVAPNPWQNDTYLGEKNTSPFMSMEYAYRFQKWLSFGAVLSYGSYSYRYYDLYTDKQTRKESGYYGALTPTVRFHWYNSRMVSLYSAFGLGLAYASNSRSNYEHYNSEYRPSIQFNVLGVSVGRKLFGFSELSLGTNGIFVVGVGYRFNEKSKR